MIKTTLVAAALCLGLAAPAEAGCVTGAMAGAVVGHMAGHHAVAGAAAGCAIGHHHAAKAKKAKMTQQGSGQDSSK
jgi:hypothetical protein